MKRLWWWIKLVFKYLVIGFIIGLIIAALVSLALDVVLWLFANHYCWSDGEGIIACGFNF